MDENEFEYKGLVYVASKEIDGDNCECCGCAFDIPKDCKGMLRPPCSSKERVDGVGVIFVEKQQ